MSSGFSVDDAGGTGSVNTKISKKGFEGGFLVHVSFVAEMTRMWALVVDSWSETYFQERFESFRASQTEVSTSLIPSVEERNLRVSAKGEGSESSVYALGSDCLGAYVLSLTSVKRFLNLSES